MSQRTFVLEVGTEELPTAWVEPALDAIGEVLCRRLADAGLAHGPVRTMGTPRRLAVLIEGLAGRQADAMREDRGPPRSACFDGQGTPTKALVGFAASKGVPVESIVFRADAKGEYAYARVHVPGRTATEVLADILPDAVLAPPFPKTMRWGHRRVRYGRPIQWLLALFGAEVVTFGVEDLVSGRVSRGHRFLGAPEFSIASADEYVAALEAQYVMVDHRRRRAEITRQVRELAAGLGGTALYEDDLVDENLHLVEWPTALVGSFPETYLGIPHVVLTTVMRKHQRYFPVADSSGCLLPYFIAVRNGGSEGTDTVRRGNEWVLVGRLEDGRFSFEQDRRQRLADRVPQLGRITFVEGLGTLDDKRRRLVRLGEAVAAELGLGPSDSVALARAAELCKADLACRLVIEFPSLQGIVGGLYAEADGEPSLVAGAIRDHYLPVAVGDELPETVVGRALSLVDKMDHVAGCLSLGFVPSGAGDPQGLRRRAQGMLSLVIDGRLPVDLVALFERACVELSIEAEGIRGEFMELLEQRAHAVLERHGLPRHVREAVLCDWGLLHTAVERGRVLESMLAARDAEFLDAARAATRAGNIVSKRESDRIEVDPALFEHPAEAPLLAAIRDLESSLATVSADAFAERVRLFAKVAPAIDALFDGPMVMAEEPELRANRLAMLYRAHRLFCTVAEFSRLELPEQG
ncbi:MAG TPA: glycine--tRNA ligase subunit beta [Armatimonadota bacterium]|nr:glycine--tRNA ligase subunit beta [Armatimonadota bacterium]